MDGFNNHTRAKGVHEACRVWRYLILVFEFLIVAVLFRRVKMLASGRGNLAWIAVTSYRVPESNQEMVQAACLGTVRTSPVCVLWFKILHFNSLLIWDQQTSCVYLQLEARSFAVLR